MSFEILGLEKADIDKAHARALETMRISQLNEEDFIGIYPEEEIRKDLSQVHKLESQFQQRESSFDQENKKIADILEAIVLEHGMESYWFGEDARTRKTSKYDDYVNGVDLVVEFGDEPESPLGLAVDVTFSQDSMKKFERNRMQIERGELSMVKYYHSELTGKRKKLDYLPYVVIGASKKTVLELAEMQLHKQWRTFSRHPFQIRILHQIKAQLEVSAIYANRLNTKEGYFAERMIYERIDIIDRIIESKKDIEKEVFYQIGDDEIHYDIMQFLKNWKQQIIEGR
jgi:hypothetical protein